MRAFAARGRLRPSPRRGRRALFAVMSGLPGTRLLAFDPRRAALIAIGASGRPCFGEIRWGTLFAVGSGVVDKVGERPRR